MNYRMQAFEGFDQVNAEDWHLVWSGSASPSPFMHIGFLRALEQSGSITAQTGWQPQPLMLFDENDRPVAAAALFAKGHSQGEFVFDWSWANAFEQAGRRYYPKWLVASPVSPVPGSRLLATDSNAQKALARALTEVARQSGLSSAHLLFGTEEDHAALTELGWLQREGVQFHWFNRGYRDFEEFLATLTQPKRKKIRAERRRVREAGVECRMISGSDISEADWDHFYACYSRTYYEHGNPPYLNREFFSLLHAALPENCALALAHADNPSRPIAAALVLLDVEEKSSAVSAEPALRQASARGSAAYGRYWGALEHVPMLHFELSYYTPLEWIIERGISRFEGGAQGEHKMARGFEPVRTFSSHWLADGDFRAAVDRFLQREGMGMAHYRSELEERLPFKPSP